MQEKRKPGIVSRTHIRLRDNGPHLDKNSLDLANRCLNALKCTFAPKVRGKGIVLVTCMWVWLLGSFAACSYAQPVKDTGNFISYTDKILIKTNFSTQTDKYILKENNSTSLKLQPNNEYRMFLSLDYEFIGFSYGFSPKILGANDDNDRKGKSSFTDYKFLLFLGQWLQTVEYSRIKGYYVENTADFVPGWQKGTDPYIQINNLTNTQWAMSTAYIVNRNFSFKNLVYQTEWQKKSAGSLVPVMSYDYNRYSFDFSGNRSVQKDFNLRLGLGYYYTFIIGNRFFVSPNLQPSLGLRFSSYSSVENGITTREHKNYFTRFVEGGIKVGFNTPRLVAGAGFNFNVNWYNEDKSSVSQNDKLFGILYFGYRFGAPRILTDTYSKMSKKLGL